MRHHDVRISAISAAFVRLDEPAKLRLLKGDMPPYAAHVPRLRAVFYAPCLDEAKGTAAAFLAKWGERLPTACGTFATDLEDCLTFYSFPEAHWKRTRTSNVLERAFKEVRRRTRVVERFPTERSALVLIWASIEQGRLR